MEIILKILTTPDKAFQNLDIIMRNYFTFRLNFVIHMSKGIYLAVKTNKEKMSIYGAHCWHINIVTYINITCQGHLLVKLVHF